MKWLSRLVVVVSVILVMFALYRHRGEIVVSQQGIPVLAKKPLDVTVFVHGTIGAAVGLMNFNQVYNDEIKGTSYSAVVKGMREDPFFLKDQLIEARGLVKITPSFDHANPDNFFRAVYPLCELYDIMQQRSGLGAVDRRYYTFGWSGLLSQSKRRLDAIRLYNHLAAEAEKFSQEGYEPRITLVGYSHGGSLILLLAAIDALVRWGDDILEAKHISDDQRETLKEMRNIIKLLPEKQKTALKVGEKAYDYVPHSTLPRIKTTLLMGTPIYSETDLFCASPLFDNMILLYSEADTVQGNDVFTTRKRASEQRLNESRFKTATKFFKNFSPDEPHITHARICRKNLDRRKEVPQKRDDESFMWKMMVALFTFGEDESQEEFAPNHRDLWFIAWKKVDDAPEPFYKLIPPVVLTPYLMEVCCKNPTLSDVDFITELEKNVLSLRIVDRAHKTTVKESTIPREEVNVWVDKIKSLKPAYATVADEIKNMSKYLNPVQK